MYRKFEAQLALCGIRHKSQLYSKIKEAGLKISYDTMLLKLWLVSPLLLDEAIALKQITNWQGSLEELFEKA